MKDLKRFLVEPDSSIREVMSCIDQNAKGIALVVDEARRLTGTITDGDIRRAILDGIDLGSPAQQLLDRRSSTPYPEPITAPDGTPDAGLVQLMNLHAIRQVPLLDDEGRVVDLALLGDLVKEYESPLTAVVMAGGYGTRLRPLTERVPKPMLPIGDRPLMELIIEQLRQSGIRQVKVTTNYLADRIKEHFSDGQDFGVDIDYVDEDRPLGTAGALGLMEAPEEPLLVINGDILTRVDFRAMLAYHREHEADLTVGVRQYDLEVPYGVVECDGATVRRLSEKPRYSFLVNAGIYLLDPAVHGYIPSDRRFDMTDLIERLLEEGRTVVSFPIVEYWLDIGEPIDYEQAQADVRDGRIEVDGE
jgi:dTDP-glucose pyrophosphorylase/CBS domain-containing protein